jgi:hypothetical protein
MSKKSQRKFWKYINKFKNNNKSKSSDVSTNDFVEHFKNISNKMQYDFSFDDVHEVRYEEVNIDDLDRPSDIEEV